jgi:large subunit ribosomal protein L25
MEDFRLNVQERTAQGQRVKHLRAEGVIPAVVYGAEEPVRIIQVEERALSRLLARGGATQLVHLEGEDIPETRVLIREVQRHPVRRNLLHVDFVRIARGARVRMAVPLVVLGEAPATEEGAVLLQNADSIEIECLPDNLPSNIQVDISGLVSIHDRITPADLVLPDGVVLVDTESEEPLISLTVPRAVLFEEEEELEVAEELMEEGEVPAEEAEEEAQE